MHSTNAMLLELPATTYNCCRSLDKQTHKQTHKPTHKQTHKQTNKQTIKPTNQPTDQPTNKQTNKPTKGVLIVYGTTNNVGHDHPSRII